ncbi:hypothetical protein G1K75_12415 [Tenacibaculum finnmarkense]|uniref:putative phage abortive infection protein n=1 Tax=Tenacibaculum finnmarkense TaxID=2781243 RepID=UPI001EFC2AEB|nr:putative phage abortive infection protein [Tenacibaculum finnmarkense]MCG8806455.1 hypothetical protein [Tenacibaculum finnmarkense]MCG8857577.1 hypothetical protein [Tenacibaculum finnmarkense]
MDSFINNKKFQNFITPVIIILLLILTLPYIFTQYSIIDFTNTGNIGDTIGGILGPFIAIVAAILTFLAFYIQFEANEQQKHDLKIERFENKFYELLRLHKDNVNELSLSENINSRKTFVHLNDELRTCYKVCEFCYDENYKKYNIDLLKFSYNIFYYGIGSISDKYLFKIFNDNEKLFYEKVKTHLILFQKKYNHLSTVHPQPSSKIYVYQEKPNYISLNLLYSPFNGHTSRLGHYFRHLYQISKFVLNDNSKLEFDDSQKYEYLKTLRSQLSDHEQLLMYYNSLAFYESEWKVLFTKYRLIKNIPIPLADFGKSPEKYFSEEIKNNPDTKIFSWQ